MVYTKINMLNQPVLICFIVENTSVFRDSFNERCGTAFKHVSASVILFYFGLYFAFSFTKYSNIKVIAICISSKNFISVHIRSDRPYMADIYRLSGIQQLIIAIWLDNNYGYLV